MTNSRQRIDAASKNARNAAINGVAKCIKRPSIHTLIRKRGYSPFVAEEYLSTFDKFAIPSALQKYQKAYLIGRNNAPRKTEIDDTVLKKVFKSDEEITAYKLGYYLYDEIPVCKGTSTKFYTTALDFIRLSRKNLIPNIIKREPLNKLRTLSSIKVCVPKIKTTEISYIEPIDSMTLVPLLSPNAQSTSLPADEFGNVDINLFNLEPSAYYSPLYNTTLLEQDASESMPDVDTKIDIEKEDPFEEYILKPL